MEGNLTRARSSLYITPSNSMSSIHSSSPLSRSTPSPPDAERRIIVGLGVPPAQHRQTHSSSVSPSGLPGHPGHMRILSENSIPSYSPQRGVPSPVKPSFSSQSGNMDNKHVNSPLYSTPSSAGSNHHNSLLEPLSEDSATPLRDLDHEYVRASTAEPYSSRTTDHRVLTRSTSSMQMRDLTDKMKDLKGKISSLRDRAREDTMKRRSLQSLRTPSPFAAAEQWYTSAGAYKTGGLSAEAGIAHSPWNGEPSVTGSNEERGEKVSAQVENESSNKDGQEPPSIYESVEGEQEIDDENPAEAALKRDMPSSFSEYDDNYDTAGEGDAGEEAENDEYVDELVDHDELEEYQSESDVSQYHDTLATPISHEDREDAFDYEHFFLHSAMGTIGRRGSVNSLDSFGSEGSVETTRGPEALGTRVSAEEISRGHVRSQKSTDSVSTLASFATATEGRRSSDIPYEDNKRNHAVQSVSTPYGEEPTTDVVVKRSTFGQTTKTELSPVFEATSSARSSVIESSNSNNSHRPSISSFSSTGTTRSFPLVNRPKNLMGTEPPILNETLAGSVIGRQPSPVDALAREDQILVERLVASLGKCIVGLQEAGRASSEGRMWRRRLDAARRTLDGHEGAM